MKLDLSIVLGLIAGVTSSIGLGATYSTTYYSPFHVARTFATLDHLTGGRAAWNVVTSVNDGEAQNFGFDQHPRPRRPLRPRRRVPRGDHRAVGHVGRRRARDGPRQRVLRRPRQGARARPRRRVVQGPRAAHRAPHARRAARSCSRPGRRVAGMDFAARWAELIFTGDPGVDVARSHYKEQKDRIAEFGRDADAVRMLPMAYTVVGESQAQAEEREQVFLNDLVDPDRVADPAVRAHELRLLVAAARRADHRRADRVGVGHPRSGEEPPPAHRRRHHPRRPGRPPRHPAAGPALRRAPARESPTRWRSGSPPTRATAS